MHGDAVERDGEPNLIFEQRRRLFLLARLRSTAKDAARGQRRDPRRVEIPSRRHPQNIRVQGDHR